MPAEARVRLRISGLRFGAGVGDSRGFRVIHYTAVPFCCESSSLTASSGEPVLLES